jgi:hypothetical protein
MWEESGKWNQSFVVFISVFHECQLPTHCLQIDRANFPSHSIWLTFHDKL